MIDPDFIASLADIADDEHPRTFNEAVAEAYVFDTPIGPVTYADFIELCDLSSAATARIDKQIVNEEIFAFAAYLRAVARSRSTMRRIAHLEGPPNG